MNGDSPASQADFLTGGGAMAAKIQAHDWSASPLGSPETWPQSLKIAASMVLGSKFPACIVWGSSRTTIYNDAFRPILGAKPEALGRPFNEVWSETWDKIGPIADRALAGEATFIEHFPLVVERNGFPEQAFFTFSYSPIRNEAGIVVGFLDTVIETTAEVTTQAAMRESEARFRNLADHAPVMIWVSELTGACVYLSRSWYEFTGQSPEIGLGFGWLDAIHPDDRPRTREAFLAANASRKAFRLDYRLRRHDGEFRWAIDAAAPRFSDDGSFLGYVGSVLDIHERKRWEEHQQLLVNELNHRVKNTLTTVQAIANQTFKGSYRDGEAQARFEGRLFALAKTHDVLTRENWEGAELHDIIAEVIEPYSRAVDDRFEIDGPHLLLDPSTALSLAMAVHELTTNAAKYGALSVPAGRVAIQWKTTLGNPEHLIFRWEEKGGPLVSPPTRRGFGTRLIKRSLARELSGEVHLKYEPSGLICEVSAVLRGEEFRRKEMSRPPTAGSGHDRIDSGIDGKVRE